MPPRRARAIQRHRRRALFSALAWLGVGAVVLFGASSMFGGPVRLVVVRGSSMDPTYASGDLILVERLTTPEVGDVISYPIEGRPGREAHVVHRAIGGGPDGFVTRGDNRTTDDPWTPSAGEIDGRVALHLTGVGRLLTGWLLPVLAAAMAGMAMTWALWPDDDGGDQLAPPRLA